MLILFLSAYGLYAGLNKRSKRPAAAARFKETFARKDVRVHFVGVWYAFSNAISDVKTTNALWEL